MTNMIIVALITRNSIGTNEFGQSLMTDMTKATMPEGGGGCCSGKGRSRSAGWSEEWVKVTRAIAPVDHATCL